MNYLASFEMSDGLFHTYSIFLAASGLALLVMGIGGIGAYDGSRVLYALVGLGFVGYAIYLEFFLPAGGTVEVLWYVFVIPIALIFNAVRAISASRDKVAPAPTSSPVPTQPLPGATMPAPPGYPPAQPAVQPQPGYPAAQPGYPTAQPGYPTAQPAYPPQPGYPPAPQFGAPPQPPAQWQPPAQ